jgi:hypothetical protein
MSLGRFRFGVARDFVMPRGFGSHLIEHSEAASQSDFRSFVHVSRQLKMSSEVHKLQNKGNQNWGKSGGDIPNTPTSFEEMVRRLNLSEKEYRSSVPLKEWAQEHKDSKYVPQDLLEAWGIVVNV